MAHQELFLILGQLTAIIAIAIVILLLTALILGIILIKKQIFIMPKIVVFVIDFLYSPLKNLARLLGFEELMIDHIGVEIRNQINAKKFNEVDDNKKIIVFPHCLRNPNCPAKLEEIGIVCTNCGRCAIGEIKPKAEELGYRIFIIPGSTFIKKIVQNYEFESVLGIACYEDLNMSMMKLSDYSPQGVLLTRTGCYNTKVDIENILEKIGYKSKKNNKTKNTELNNDITSCSKTNPNEN